jgi:SAM-dependent methyltransferase
MQDETKAAERVAFDSVPEVYDRVRPGYPPALFDEMFRYLREGIDTREPRVVEIGAGTGKATIALLERGARVTAVEIGPEMSAFLRRKFASEERLQVINAPFEDAELAPNAYDLVTSFTAFHWLDREVRFVKSREVLRPGGALAVVMTNQIASEVDRGFFERTFPIYLEYRPDEQHTESPGENVVPVEYDAMLAISLFDDVTLRRYRWDQTYPTEAYADLVRSYAGTQMMEPGPREALIADLSEVIDREYGGSVTRPLVMTLTMGRKT